jgi:hypothetical protein
MRRANPHASEYSDGRRPVIYYVTIVRTLTRLSRPSRRRESTA